MCNHLATSTESLATSTESLATSTKPCQLNATASCSAVHGDAEALSFNHPFTFFSSFLIQSLCTLGLHPLPVCDVCQRVVLSVKCLSHLIDNLTETKRADCMGAGHTPGDQQPNLQTLSRTKRETHNQNTFGSETCSEKDHDIDM